MPEISLKNLSHKLHDQDELVAFVVRFAVNVVADMVVATYTSLAMAEVEDPKYLPDLEAAHGAVVARVRERFQKYSHVFGEDEWGELWSELEAAMAASIQEAAKKHE